jgi:hypothetical protein
MHQYDTNTASIIPKPPLRHYNRPLQRFYRAVTRLLRTLGLRGDEAKPPRSHIAKLALLNPGMKWMLYARNLVSIHNAFQQRLQNLAFATLRLT